ncbi:MAG: ChaN family lipoprotein [Burkholderiales bacterium]|nr:ChaN family lipoprotein [Burkholderiales bacterium]
MRLALALLLPLLLVGPTPHAWGATPASRAASDTPVCVLPGQWARPAAAGTAVPLDAIRTVADAARRRVVLLGESHDVAEHHRWQLHMLAALHAQQPDLVLALEMFPRSSQPVLDRWVAGTLSERAFLDAVRWDAVWGYDARLYLPLFHFARMHRLPMVAVNVEPGLTREVGERGFAGVPESRREGLTAPAAPLPEYTAYLRDSFGMHATPESTGGPGDAADADARFRRFVEAQQIWDRAMAQGIAGAVRARPGALVVALIGAGHLFNGWGVPHQLRDLGIADPLALLPWEPGTDCARLRPGYADAVFGLQVREERDAAPQRLGVRIDLQGEAVTIADVERGSLGERVGLKARDVVVEVAGVAPREAADLVAAVRRQPPGTWLPLKVRRAGKVVELVARFPAGAPAP